MEKEQPQLQGLTIETVKFGAYYNYTTKNTKAVYILRPLEKHGDHVYCYMISTESIVPVTLVDFLGRSVFLKDATPADLNQLKKIVTKMYRLAWNSPFTGNFGLKEVSSVIPTVDLMTSAQGNKEERKTLKENLKMLKEKNTELLEKFRKVKTDLTNAKIADEKKNLKHELRDVSIERRAVRNKIKSTVGMLKNG